MEKQTIYIKITVRLKRMCNMSVKLWQNGEKGNFFFSCGGITPWKWSNIDFPNVSHNGNSCNRVVNAF